MFTVMISTENSAECKQCLAFLCMYFHQLQCMLYFPHSAKTMNRPSRSFWAYVWWYNHLWPLLHWMGRDNYFLANTTTLLPWLLIIYLYTHDILLSWIKLKRMHQRCVHYTLFIHSIKMHIFAAAAHCMLNLWHSNWFTWQGRLLHDQWTYICKIFF